MYGYKIINGKAVIDEQEAGIIISIFNGYISGLSMKAAAENAGVFMQHSTVKRILMQDIYIGTDYYPAIISRETFAKANGRRIHRASLHSCEKRYTAPSILKAFELAAAETHFNDPVQQAEYIYSLIEVKKHEKHDRHSAEAAKRQFSGEGRSETSAGSGILPCLNGQRGAGIQL